MEVYFDKVDYFEAEIVREGKEGIKMILLISPPLLPSRRALLTTAITCNGKWRRQQQQQLRCARETPGGLECVGENAISSPRRDEVLKEPSAIRWRSQSEGMRSSVAEQVVVHLVPTTRLLLPLAALCKFMHKPLLATKQVKVHA